MLIETTMIQDIKQIIAQARENAVRADYGAYLIKTLATELEPEFGSGFCSRQLERYRQFYRAFLIATALRSQLNWTQYR